MKYPAWFVFLGVGYEALVLVDVHRRSESWSEHCNCRWDSDRTWRDRRVLPDLVADMMKNFELIEYMKRMRRGEVDDEVIAALERLEAIEKQIRRDDDDRYTHLIVL